MRKILIIGPIAAAALVFAAAAVAAPSLSPSYRLTGIELGASQADASAFVGVGTGSTGDHASWQASIAHASLAGCASTGASCAVTGGSFTLASNSGARLDGTFTGGMLTLTAQQARSCGSQTFAVTAIVSTSTALEQFTGSITEHRAPIRGVCTVVVAVLQGTLALVDDGGSL